MAAVTGTQLVTRALKLLGAIEGTATPKAAEVADGLVHINAMFDAWSINRLRLRGVVRRALQLAAGTASYTLGPSGGTWTAPIPIYIERLSVVPDRTASPVLEVPIGLPLSVGEYQAVQDKTVQSSYPYRVYIDSRATSNLITLYPLPIANVNTADLIVYAGEEIAAFADASTSYYLPKGSERAIVYNLALAMAPEWDRTPSPEVVTIARNDLAALEARNVVVPDLMLEPIAGYGGRGYDIYTDS